LVSEIIEGAYTFTSSKFKWEKNQGNEKVGKKVAISQFPT
jgi:hypothetical protein